MNRIEVSTDEIEHRCAVSGQWLTVYANRELHLRIGSTLYVAPLATTQREVSA